MNIANRLTVFRIFLIPLYFIFLLYSFPNNKLYTTLSFLLLVVIAFGDAVDGFLARKLHQVTKLGTILDPIADKLAISISFVILGVYQGIPAWLVIIVISKDVLIFLGWFILYILNCDVTVIPSIFGKVSSFLQFSVVLLHFIMKVTNIFDSVIPVIWWFTCAATIAAGISYVYDGMKRLNGDKQSST
ncbi:CDP-alcohol phosphatidyltransferase family protein [bacterium]|nr:CDP-alcohol phosphatidyltransferase family protein [bacterium]